MDRQEFATRVRGLVNQAFLHGVENKYYKGLVEEVEKLREPLTLAEFLGWEEGVEYEYWSGKYKIVDGELLYYWNMTKDYEPAKVYLNRSSIQTMREAEKVEHEKQYRIPLPNLITTDGKQQYLTERDGCWFACRLTEGLKQEWTEDEFHGIPTAYLGYAKEIGEDEYSDRYNVEAWRVD